MELYLSRPGAGGDAAGGGEQKDMERIFMPWIRNDMLVP